MLHRYALLALALVACGGGGAPMPAADAGTDAAPACEPSTAFAPLVLDGPGEDAVRALAVAADGTIVVGGYERGGKPARFDPDGDSLAFVSGHAADGAQVWRHVIDTAGTDAVDALLVDGDTLYVAGHTGGTLPGFANKGQHDALLARVDAGGTLALLDQHGTERPQRPRRLVRQADQLVAVGWDEIYVPSNYVESWEDPLVIRWRLAGDGVERVALTTWGTDAPDVLWGATPLGDDLLLAGQVLSGIDRGAFVTRVTPGGERAWTASTSAQGTDTAVAVFVDGDELVVVGTAFPPAGEVGVGQQDVYVARLDAATGEIRSRVWSGGLDSDWVIDVVRLADGRLLVHGETLATIAPGLTSAGGQDLFVLELDPDGAPRAAWQGGSRTDDVGGALLVDACGRVLVGGAVTSDAAGGDVPASGGLDGVVWQVELAPLP
jgi:hypothetical protein